MSLINQMLQDLDSRRATECVGVGLPNDVRPLPVRQPNRWPMLLAVGLLLAIVVAGGTWYVLELKGAPVILSAEPPVIAAQSSVSSDSSAAVAIIPAAPGGNLSLQSDGAPDLRMTTSLLLPETWADAPAPRAARDKVPPASSASTKSLASSVSAPVSAKSSAAPAPAASASSSRPSGPASIEKSAPAGSSSDRAEVEYRRAQSILNQGRSPEALEALRAALKLNAGHIASRQLLLKLLIENKQFDEADSVLREGLVLHPTQIAWAMSLARMQLDRGDIPGAWKTLEHSLPAATGSSDYQGFAGHVLQRLGRARESVDFYQTATRLAPAEGRWWLGLGLALESDGRVVQAREAYANARATGTLGAELQTYVEQKLR